MKRPVSSRPRTVRRRSPRGFGAGAAALLAAACAVACGGGGGADGGGPVFGVLTAMPSELGAVLEYVAVDDVREVDGRWFHSGRIGSTPVVVAMTGVGLENARATTRTLVATFDVAGVVVSGVATSPFGIGDVTVAAPLALSGLLEFFAYYRLAARNAASAAAVFLGAGGPA